MRQLKDFSAAELVTLKANYNKIEFNDCPGETRWCDRIAPPWERFVENVDPCVNLMFGSKNISDDDRLHMRKDNPELYDLLEANFR